jgi:hypothetical protein
MQFQIEFEEQQKKVAEITTRQEALAFMRSEPISMILTKGDSQDRRAVADLFEMLDLRFPMTDDERRRIQATQR